MTGLLLIFSLASPVFALPHEVPSVVSSAQDVQTYEGLLSAIRAVRSASQKRVERAVDQEKVREAWETGKLIDAHVLQHKERADYGVQVLKRLAVDLRTSDTELYRMLEFFRQNPISAPAQKLGWAYYREIISLKEYKDREAVIKQAVEQHWNRAQVREEVRRRQARAVSQEPEELPVSGPGNLYTYRVVKAAEGPYAGQLVLDLSFSNYFQPDTISQFKEGDVVVLEKGKLEKMEAGEDALFTYNAYVTEIVDGDTFHALIDLGFKITTLQTLRLRGLDAPQVESADGREAKAFLEKYLPIRETPVLIQTAKSDKYDRYLVGVWIGETYLNQKLIDEGLAVRVEE